MTNNDALIEFTIACKSDYLKAPVIFLSGTYNKALVIETQTHYLLQSYETIVASINKADGTGIDALRYQYKYTRTSARHVSQFMNDYGALNCFKLV